jgi:hypothetical protein
MSIPSTPSDLLKQIAGIQHLEKGKLCVLRQGPNGPYYNLQRWENGRNVSQYVPADQVATVRENLEAHAQFEALSAQYVELLSERTRAQRLSGVKKKRQTRNSPSPRKPKSNS